MSAPDDWLSLWKVLGARGDPNAIYSNLLAHYSEPHRAYHNLHHISHCLREWQSVRSDASQPHAVEFALWFHDVIYNPRAKDNEEKSASLAVSIATSAGLSSKFVATVTGLILATQHQSVPETQDARLLVDIDLAILGQSVAGFNEYEGKIRAEYAWVPDPQFRIGRATVLKHFLHRPSIYVTDFFRLKYENQARLNLERSLVNWTAAF